MITINLRPGLKRKRAGSPLKAITERFQGLGDKVSDPMLMSAAAAWIVAVGFLGTTWFMTQRDLAAVEPRLELAKSEHHRFKTFLQQKHKQELIRDSLLAQIGTIRAVDGSRYIWPHVLDEVTKALPAYTWLTTLQAEVPPGGVAADSTADSTGTKLAFRLEGRTVDIQAYTRFLRQLEASPFLSDVTAISVTTVVEQERPVTAFTIRAEFQQADSAYVRTVSLDESVR